MNNILQLKGRFQQRARQGGPPIPSLPKNAIVKEDKLVSLKHQLLNVQKYWHSEYKVINGVLVSAYYSRVVAKSNRLQTLLAVGSKNPNDSIRGARFTSEPVGDVPEGIHKHVITHFVETRAIADTIDKLDSAVRIIHDHYGGKISYSDVVNINAKGLKSTNMSKSQFLKVVIDAHYVAMFLVDESTTDLSEKSIITIYKTGVNTKKLLSSFDIKADFTNMIDDTTILLPPSDAKRLQENAPYLIAMGVRDLSTVVLDEIEAIDDHLFSIPDPVQEPVVGVIDSHFDETVYFHKWVDYRNMLVEEIQIDNADRNHGTAVSSIIVDGPQFNPGLDDGCGRFRVRHFGVAKASRFSSFTVLKLIRDIVSKNQDIKVWNLSLGSALEIEENFISPEAAELDRIQSEFDVIFIVAGTNKSPDSPKHYRIGAPADSLNSLVVNAVDSNGNSTSYTRTGPVLSFFHKPDVSYFGGDIYDPMIVCRPLGEGRVCGTSFAVPWVTRKVAYLIHNMGMSREVAKALIIHSAAGWNRQDDSSFKVGFGIVPTRIEDILYSLDDEIRFILTGSMDEYETYTYEIPVPQDKLGHPYFAKATLVYFPNSNRNQGVDYTNTEMDIHFGRSMEKNGKTKITPINNNQQKDDEVVVLYESDARKLYRKWDNVKHIGEALSSRAKPRKVYGVGLWGLSIKIKERLKAKEGRGLPFGVVITLKEMNGKNRIDEFVKLCKVSGRVVHRLDVENQIDILLKAEEEVELE